MKIVKNTVAAKKEGNLVANTVELVANKTHLVANNLVANKGGKLKAGRKRAGEESRHGKYKDVERRRAYMRELMRKRRLGS